MNALIAVEVVNGKPCVTSRQVAEAFGKEHKNVIRDIRETKAKCSESFTALNFELSEYMDSTGRKLPMYLLSKDGLMMVTMGYVTPEAMRIKEAYIAKFNAMEEQLRGPKLPDFNNPAIAARAWAEQYEQRLLAEHQRDEAIRTKAEIGSRREATAMATASRLSKENAKLQDALGIGKTWKSAKAIDWVKHYFIPSAGLWSQLGKKLTTLSREMGYEVRRMETSEYPNGVGLYHEDVIKRLHARLDAHPEMLWQYRKEAVA